MANNGSEIIFRNEFLKFFSLARLDYQPGTMSLQSSPVRNITQHLPLRQRTSAIDVRLEIQRILPERLIFG